MFYNPPMSYYEPADEPEFESRVSENKFHATLFYSDGDVLTETVDGNFEDYCNEIREENEELETKIVKVEIREIWEDYYEETDWFGEEVISTEIGEVIYTEEF